LATKKGNVPLVVDWPTPIPDYVKWLHNSAIQQRAADEYTSGHVAGFHIREADIQWCPDLEGISMVYLVYKERANANPLTL